MLNILSLMNKGSILTIILMLVIVVSGLYHYKSTYELKELRTEINTMLVEIGSLQTQLEQAIQANRQLESVIQEQNNNIRQLNELSIQRQSNAEQRVEQIFIERQDLREADRRVGPKPEDMNKWLSNIFGQ